MKKYKLSKKDLVLILFAAIFAFVMTNNILHIRDILQLSLPIVALTASLILLTLVVMVAGAIIIRSLAFVAAELSLIVFLAQSYCDPGVVRTSLSDGALKSLLIIGLTYVAYKFLRDVYEKLVDFAKEVKKTDGEWSWEATLFSGLLLTFVVIFAAEIYLVVNPIIGSLCIYKS